jgi:sugar diacid utilization regulator
MDAVSELQQIVDSLGMRLQRSVAIDDRQLRIQAYSPHYGPVDHTRLGSILQRQAPPEAIKWVNNQGIREATSPIHLPACEEVGMLPRVCVPIIHQDERLGYLWLIESGESLTSEQLEVAEQSARDAAVVMYRERLLREIERGQERELLRDLISPDPAFSASAATRLVDQELLIPGRVAALVLRPVSGVETGDEECQLAIDTALVQARRTLAPRRAVHLARPDHGLLVVSLPARSAPNEEPAAIGEQLLQSFMALHVVDASSARAVVGIGDVQKTLGDAAVSYRQASQATRVSEVLAVMGDVVRWADLGVYRLLIQLPPEELTTEALPPGLVTLLADESSDVLVNTLECFLDLAGNIKETAAALLIHRTTLYYRLSRLEELARVDLNRGADRLVLHLGIKMARLAGLFPRKPGINP